MISQANMLSFSKTLPFLVVLISTANAATFDITNRCGNPVWAAASPGGGKRLESIGAELAAECGSGHGPSPNMGADQLAGSTGRGKGSVRQATATGGWSARGTAEFALNQPNNLDYVDISLVDGFNIPMEFSPTTNVCRNLRCTAPIKEQCPNQLRAPGGCNNPCTVFGTNKYCCTNGRGSCSATVFSRFFKERCPNAYSYPQDDPTSLFTCPAGTNYRVVFCP